LHGNLKRGPCKIEATTSGPLFQTPFRASTSTPYDRPASRTENPDLPTPALLEGFWDHDGTTFWFNHSNKNQGVIARWNGQEWQYSRDGRPPWHKISGRAFQYAAARPFILAEPEVASCTPTPTGSRVPTPALKEAEEGHTLSTPKAKFPASEVEEVFNMAQQVDVAQALATMGNAITGLTQAINQIITGLLQQHNVSVSTTGAIVGAGVEKPAKFKGEKDDIQKNAEDARRFLATYKVYACPQPALNMVDAQGVVTRKDS
jgi:hypothetical protein